MRSANKSTAFQVVDTGAPSFFWRAHTVTVLLVLICVLVYKVILASDWSAQVTWPEYLTLIGQHRSCHVT